MADDDKKPKVTWTILVFLAGVAATGFFAFVSYTTLQPQITKAMQKVVDLEAQIIVLEKDNEALGERAAELRTSLEEMETLLASYAELDQTLARIEQADPMVERIRNFVPELAEYPVDILPDIVPQSAVVIEDDGVSKTYYPMDAESSHWQFFQSRIRHASNPAKNYLDAGSGGVHLAGKDVAILSAIGPNGNTASLYLHHTGQLELRQKINGVEQSVRFFALQP
ncbi:MAG: hypothetical protein AAFX79_05810 [Planctomycetota bacterium]